VGISPCDILMLQSTISGGSGSRCARVVSSNEINKCWRAAGVALLDARDKEASLRHPAAFLINKLREHCTEDCALFSKGR